MKVKRQHYVPEGFLKGFAVPDEAPMIWVYEKLPQRKPRKVSTKQIAWEEYYYQQETPSGEIDFDSFERALATTIDNAVPPILQRLTPSIGRVLQITEDERNIIAFFIGLSMTRVPSVRQGIQDIHTRIGNIAMSYEAEKDSLLHKLFEDGVLRVEAKSWVSLEPMIRMAEQIALSILKKNWQFYVAPVNVPFVTSDNPVIFSGGLVPNNPFVGPAHPAVEVVINLRSDLSLVCTPRRGYPENHMAQLKPIEARKFNRGIIRAARRFVFADRYLEGLEKATKKYVGEEQKISV